MRKSTWPPLSAVRITVVKFYAIIVMIVPESVRKDWMADLERTRAEKEKVRNLESKTNETIETIKTQLEVEKIKNSELQKKLELLEMSQMALVSRLEAIENM